MINDLIAPLYERFFDWDSYQYLFNMVWDHSDYQKMGIVVVLFPIILLMIFYKFWDPVRNARFKWMVTLLIAGILSYLISSSILYMNSEIAMYIANYTGEGPNGEYFIFQMSGISFLYSTFLSFLLSIGFKYFSAANTHNPF